MPLLAPQTETGLTVKFMLETGSFREFLQMPEFSPIHSIVRLIARKCRYLTRDLQKGPFTVTHGDVKADNFFFEYEEGDTEGEYVKGIDKNSYERNMECAMCDLQVRDGRERGEG